MPHIPCQNQRADQGGHHCPAACRFNGRDNICAICCHQNRPQIGFHCLFPDPYNHRFAGNICHWLVWQSGCFHTRRNDGEHRLSLSLPLVCFFTIWQMTQRKSHRIVIIIRLQGIEGLRGVSICVKKHHHICCFRCLAAKRERSPLEARISLWQICQ